MQNEKCFYGYCNEFEYNHDYVKSMMKYSYIYIITRICVRVWMLT